MSLNLDLISAQFNLNEVSGPVSIRVLYFVSPVSLSNCILPGLLV